MLNHGQRMIDVDGSILMRDDELSLIDSHNITTSMGKTSKSSRSFLSSLGFGGPPADQVYEKANKDSDGFFDYISDEEWKAMKRETKAVIDAQDGIMMRCVCVILL